MIIIFNNGRKRVQASWVFMGDLEADAQRKRLAACRFEKRREYIAVILRY